MTDPFAKLTHASPGRRTGEILRQFFDQHSASGGRRVPEGVMV